jgi:cephalosporin-C deacetylase-like acetyl esterase
LSSFGAYDVAGNVREWCFNQTTEGRLVRGGSYADPPYRYTEESQAPPMTRSGEYGFRTVHLPDTQPIPKEVFETTTFAVTQQLDMDVVVTDEVFEFFRRQFDYDQQPLNPRVESRIETAEEWVLERVVVDGAYGNEELIINLFLPSNVKPPYQTVIYFPGSGSLFRQSSENIADYYEYPTFLSFLVKTGRAVAYPVYKGTFERHDETLIPFHLGGSSLAHRDYLVQLVQDFRRTLDYLDERQDIDSDRYAYYGMSWGAILGVIIPAVEPRLKAAILLGGGLISNEMPETNPVHYARRIQVPMLMLVGRYDSMIGFESAIEPLYRLFGTAPEDKVMKAYDTDHIPPKSEFVTEILKWLDRYLGPVGSD